jgi:hypothetical protein
MKAKINFFGKQVGEHQNILLFVGAVVDNGTRKSILNYDIFFKVQVHVHCFINAIDVHTY